MIIKMRHDKYTDFDLELRSMLQNAEEEVPSRVWDALSAELDRKERGRVVTLWWRRAAVGLSVAAAALAGFVLFNGRDAGETGIQTIPSTIVAESGASGADSQGEALSIEEQIASSSATMLADVPGSRSLRIQGTVPDGLSSLEEAAEEAVVEALDQDATAEEAAVPESPSAVTPSQKGDTQTGERSTAGEEDWADPFAQMAYEDAHRSSRRGLSLSVDGSAATNDRSPDGGFLPGRAPSAGTAAGSTGVTEKSSSTFGVPVSFGAGVKFSVSDKLSVGTGLSYSLLSRSFSGIYNSTDGHYSVNSDIYNELHYLGVPLNLYWDIISSPDLKFYLWGGGSIEKGLVNKYRIYNKPENIIFTQGIGGVQLSTAVGLGLEFTLTDYLGLYIDPSVRYYFDCRQPVSVRTMKPFMMNFELGFRFNL